VTLRYYRKLSSWPFGSLSGQHPARRDRPVASVILWDVVRSRGGKSVDV
jgi:hypothetical protein